MCKSFLKVGLFTIALVATGAYAEGTVDPNHPDSRYQMSQSTASSAPADDVRNADSANWGVGS